MCPTCKGTGRSGFFPTPQSPLCRRFPGSGRCDSCNGTGSIEYQPQIYVCHSLSRPTSVSCGAVTNGFWRFVKIPPWVRRRSEKAQLHWVKWRVRQHFIEHHGKLPLFGEITGYRFDKDDDLSVKLDTEGRYIGTVRWVLRGAR